MAKRMASGAGRGTGPAKKITAWSWSRYTDHLKCPRLARYKHVDKIKEPGSKAMDRGSAIHKMAEHYVTGVLKKLPDELSQFATEFKHLRKIHKTVEVEQEHAVDKNWISSSWFDTVKTWLRCKVDAAHPEGSDTWVVIDYKTGKVRLGPKDRHGEQEPENMAQLDLYAMMGFLFGPKHIQSLRAEFWYLDQGEIYDRLYIRSDLPKLQKAWRANTKKMLADTTFKPTPSDNACKWCFFSQKAKNDPKRKGPGLCKF